MSVTVLVSDLVVTGDAYTPRWGLAAAQLHQYIYLFGGYVWFHGAERFFDELYMFDPRASSLRLIPVPEPSPCPRFGHSLVAAPSRNCLILFGGRSASFCYGDTWLFNVQTHQWTVLRPTANSPAPRSWHTANYHEDAVYVCGGWGQSSEVYGDVWRLDLETRVWECLCVSPPLPPDSTANKGDWDTPSHALRCGGVVTDASSAATLEKQEVPKGLLVVSADGQPRVCATLTEVFAAEGRTCHASVVWRRGLYVYGGVMTQHLLASSELWRFDFDSKEWTILPTNGTPPGKRVSAAATLVGDLWVFHGGLTSLPGVGQMPTSDIHQFDFLTSTWTQKRELCLIPRDDLLGASKVAKYGHAAATAPDLSPIFFGGADAYASAQTSLSWRVDFLPAMGQLIKLLDLFTGEEQERQRLVRNVHDSMDSLERRLQTLENEKGLWQVRTQEALAEYSDRALLKIDGLERQVTSLKATLAAYEPLLQALASFGSTLANHNTHGGWQQRKDGSTGGGPPSSSGSLTDR